MNDKKKYFNTIKIFGPDPARQRRCKERNRKNYINDL